MEGQGTWTATYSRLQQAAGEHALKPRELETFALAAYLTGKDTEFADILEQAHQGYLNQQNTKKAVRCAFWLGLMLVNIGERARGGGWMARGQRILTDYKPACAEKGLMLIPAALGMLSQGNCAKAQALFEEAAAIGAQSTDPDLLALARLGQGQAMIGQQEIAEGLKLLDETMILVETEEVFPVAKGLVYCAVVETCRKVWDLRRAREWTQALTRWCQAQPDIIPFRGQCLVRKAEMIQFDGQWSSALKEVNDACTLLTRSSGSPAAGEAFYRKAELQRLSGDFEVAEKCYREALKWGRDPQPGFALLRLAQGKVQAAAYTLGNTLPETKDVRRRAELLPAFVSVMIAAGRTGEAHAGADELNKIARNFDAPYLYALGAVALGAVFFAEGDLRQALDNLQVASEKWLALDLPYESAHTRELKGCLYRELHDKDNADMELAAAKWIFEQLKATPDLRRIDRLLHKRADHKTQGLSLRELQVLRRVVAGKSNKSVAGELFISPRTVDRHMSNIFNKLGVSSRVEAAAFALRNQLLENPVV